VVDRTWPDERQPTLRAKLEEGWEWLKHNADHPAKDAFYERWLAVLDAYTAAYGMIGDENAEHRAEQRGGDLVEQRTR
jgi:hypothetical protein